ncbi:uncharacterized protein K441DRAFT_570421, partial [Cenococcum geophilum 1.58]|uniref:uncharacterized protein n=1 Tax=Cenococcum geophilum 1.58 TaxID=794803 RepID=UPI00358EAB84
FEGRFVIRRFTDQFTGADELERSTKAAQAEIDEEEEREEIRPQDFGIAEIARAALQEIVDKFIEDAKPSAPQCIRIPIKSAKAKAIEVLEGSVQRDFNELKASVDNLEKWKESHGPAAKNHGDTAETLSKSMASISDKVTTCSNLILIIKTQRLRKCSQTSTPACSSSTNTP